MDILITVRVLTEFIDIATDHGMRSPFITHTLILTYTSSTPQSN